MKGYEKFYENLRCSKVHKVSQLHSIGDVESCGRREQREGDEDYNALLKVVWPRGEPYRNGHPKGKQLGVYSNVVSVSQTLK